MSLLSISCVLSCPARPRRRGPLAAALTFVPLLMLQPLIGSAAIDASSLDRELTPIGAERSGNRPGTIPAWTGDASGVPSFQPGKRLRIDAWRFKGEKPLYSIDASNVDQHIDKLSPGQVGLLKQLPGFKMDVYPSHRDCSVPTVVADNTKRNAGFAKIDANGWSIKDAYVPGIPFPLPENGLQAMWNQKLRYRGIGSTSTGYTYLSPRKGASEWIRVQSEQTVFWPWAALGSRKLSESGATVMAQTYLQYKQPVAMAGQAAIGSEYFDKAGTDAYYYFPGQRRVRRMPAYAYDAPQIGFEGQYAVDDTQVFAGTLDRFDWKLVGKKELLVPYNSFGAFDFKSEWTSAITPAGLSSSHRRYELHRVWVVEASVKPETRHLTPKRTFYLDEDSWNAVLAEDYDAQGKLVKVREGYLIPVFEIGGACDVSAFAQYNLPEGRVLLDFTSIDAGSDSVYSAQPINPAMKSGFYTPDNLRAISER